jgi:hypothetical protein
VKKTVIETSLFIATAKEAGISDDLRQFMVETIADDPMAGDIMKGTGGCRKVRFAGRGKGKSGGYRTVHYNGADDVPVLMMAVIAKGEKDNLSQAERNELRKALADYEKEYRKGVAAKVTKLKEGA